MGLGAADRGAALARFSGHRVIRDTGGHGLPGNRREVPSMDSGSRFPDDDSPGSDGVRDGGMLQEEAQDASQDLVLANHRDSHHWVDSSTLRDTDAECSV